jgi:hypothetical protein
VIACARPWKPSLAKLLTSCPVLRYPSRVSDHSTINDFGLLIAYVLPGSKKNAGKWVASKNEKVLAADVKLSTVLSKTAKEEQRANILDLVPPTPYLAGGAL